MTTKVHNAGVCLNSRVQKRRSLGCGAQPHVQDFQELHHERRRGFVEFAPRRTAAAEEMPGIENAPLHVGAGLSDEGPRAAGRGLREELFEVAFEMGPAELPLQDRAEVVDAPAVAAEDAGEGRPQELAGRRCCGGGR